MRRFWKTSAKRARGREMRPPIRNRDPGDETPTVLDLDIVTWRFDQLADAGYPTDLAVMLAERGDVDLHLAVDLLDRGATVHEAIRILT